MVGKHVLVVLAVLPLVAISCATDRDGAATVAGRAVESQLVGNPRVAWRTLAAQDRRQLNRREFIRCALLGRGRKGASARVQTIEIMRIRNRHRAIPVRFVSQARLAVTLDPRPPGLESMEDEVLIDVAHVRGRYRWLLDTRSKAIYARDERGGDVCPDIAGSY